MLDGSASASRRVRVGLAGHARGRPCVRPRGHLPRPASRCPGHAAAGSRSSRTAAGRGSSAGSSPRPARPRASSSPAAGGACARRRRRSCRARRCSLHGLGYRPHRRLRLSWAGTTGIVTVNRRGRFVANIAVPLSLTPGAWPGRLTGRGVRLGFALQVDAPPAPAPPPPAPAPPPAPVAAGPHPVAVWHMDEAGRQHRHARPGRRARRHAARRHRGDRARVPRDRLLLQRGGARSRCRPRAALNPGAANFTVTIHLRTVEPRRHPTGT